MHQMYVVSAVRFRVPSTDTVTRIEKLGFSVVQLMSISGLDATGVRADLEIQDSDALDQLAGYHEEQTELEWTFELAGGAKSIVVHLRWTRFTRSSGQVQIVRNVVMRDLIAEAEGQPKSTPLPAAPPERPPSQPSQERRPASTAPAPSSPSTSPLDSVDAKRLWPSVLGGKVVVRPRYQKQDG